MNIPNGIKESAKHLNLEMESALEKINENEEIRKLKDISNKMKYSRQKEHKQVKRKHISFIAFKKTTSSRI